MKNLFKFLGLAAVLAGFSSCSENEIETYSGTESIYFTYVEYGPDAFNTISSKPFDSLEVSFAYEAPEILEMSMKIPVAVQGQLADVDRTYKVGVTNESTAQQGVHYLLEQEQVIHANQRLDSLEITLLRTEEMKTDTITLTLELLPSDDFEVLMKDEVVNKITGEVREFNKFDLHITDILNQPRYWFAHYLGDFSAKKLFLMCDLLDLDPNMFNERVLLGDFQYYGTFMQRYLNEQEAAGNTIYEEDGSKMIMGAGVQ